VLVAKPWVAPVFEKNPHLDEVLIYDKPGRHGGVAGFIRLIAEIRKYRFDAAILFQNAFEAALMAFLSGIPRRIGYPTDGRGFLLNGRAPMPERIKSEHQVKYYQGVLKGIGVSPLCTELHLNASPESVREVEGFLKKKNSGENDRLVGVNFGAAYGPAKEWPLERFGELCDRISRDLGYRIILFGSLNSRSAGTQLEKMMKSQVINAVGITTLSEAIALIGRCALFITNDSGLMHIASALKIPMVAIFGSTNPKTTGPWNYQGKLIRNPVPCSPCLEQTCRERHFKCMTGISVETVYESVKELL
ncbi:MAG: lipopolysaccharide heptosyltransferase II, partial [Thermodesulfobacteriota bacterium]